MIKFRHSYGSSIKCVQNEMLYRGLLLDIDGTLYQSGRPIPGAVNTVARLRRNGVSLRFVTNTTSKSAASIVEKLRRMGFEARTGEVHSPPVVAGAMLREEAASAALFVPDNALDDFHGVLNDQEKPDYVVLGDLGFDWTFRRLNQAFELAKEGARLMALGRTRYWQTSHGLQLDVGPFVAALEYATGQQAITLGKPDPRFFLDAVKDLGLRPDEVAVVGDDAETDVRAAMRAGLKGILVRTGKYRDGDEAGEPPPDLVMDSVARLHV